MQAAGPTPAHGTQGRSRSYACDLARRLRQRGLTVFFREDEAPVAEQFDPTLQCALLRSRVLVVTANRATLAELRWVRTEVEGVSPEAARPRDRSDQLRRRTAGSGAVECRPGVAALSRPHPIHHNQIA